jgi:hypothetical protein
MTAMPVSDEERKNKLFHEAVSGVCPIHNCPTVEFSLVEECLIEWLVQNVLGQKLVEVIFTNKMGDARLIHANGFTLDGMRIDPEYRNPALGLLMDKISNMTAIGIKYAQENGASMIQINYANSHHTLSLTGSQRDLTIACYHSTMDRVIPD